MWRVRLRVGRATAAAGGRRRRAGAWRVPSRRTSAPLGASTALLTHRLRGLSFLRVESTPPISMVRLMKAKYSATQRMVTLISVGSLSASQKRAVNVICTGRLSATISQCVRDEARPNAQEACGGGSTCDVNN
jgi:hypothetical protein